MRTRYYHPVRLFVLLTAIYLILKALLDCNPIDMELENIETPDSKALEKVITAGQFMNRNINNVLMYLVFSIGLSLKLFFRKIYNLAEYTSIGFYIDPLILW
jgi:hypothetical protein